MSARRGALIGMVAAFFVCGIGVSARQWFLPLREVSRQAFLTYDGVAVPQYQWRYVRDMNAPAVCILTLTNEATGQFAITAVAPEACGVQ